MPQNSDLVLSEAYNLFMTELKEEQRPASYQDLNRFVQWCGRDSSVGKLTPQVVAVYADWVGTGGKGALGKLEPVKTFLSFLKRKGLINASLASHVRAPKSKGRIKNPRNQASVEQAWLTEEGYHELTARLEALKEERGKIIIDIRRAMADKDFRENAPLDAAKERQGFIESMIRELEETLSSAVVGGKPSSSNNLQVALGNKVVLKDVDSGQEVAYTLVHSTEAAPGDGKISNVSPVGKALLDKQVGKEVFITVPKGTLHYIIERIES